MNEKQNNNAIATATIRLAVIQPAFNGTFPDMSKQAYYARIAEHPLKLPDGRQVRYSPGTFSCWESTTAKAASMRSCPSSAPTRATAAGWTQTPWRRSMN